MRLATMCRASCLLAALALAAGSAAAPGGASVEDAVAFVGVHVVPMREPGIVRDQTVVVRGDRIDSLGPVGSVQIPADAVRVAARGKFLLPGLVDMHVHTSYRDEHMLYVGHGVTTIREMWAFGPGWVRFRDEIDRGESFGATMFVAGMALVGPGNAITPQNLVLTRREARKAVQRLAAEGHDFIKVHEGLGAEPYDAAVATARRIGIPVVGHVPGPVGVQAVLDSGAQHSISHLSRLYLPFGTSGWQDPVHRPEMRVLARDLRDRNIYNDATLITIRKLLFPEERAAHSQRPEYRFLPDWTMESWLDWVDRYGPWADPAYREEMLANSQAMVRELHRAGAPLLIGTDGGFPFVMPGYSLHQELLLHVRAGLTLYEVLRAATVGAAEFLGQEREFGSVEPGLRADLVLLRGNPLKRIRNTRRIAGVMVRGQWLDAAEIERRMTAVSQIQLPDGARLAAPPWVRGH